MKKKLCALLSAVMMFSLCVAPAHALELSIGAPDDYLFGRPTSDDTIYEWENPNVDHSKNTALIPPGFGTPTSYLPGSGEYLTPNLVPGALSGGLVNQVGSVGNPNGGTSSVQATYPSLPATAESSLTPLYLLSPQSLGDGFAGTPWDATGSYPAPGTSVDSSGFPKGVVETEGTAKSSAGFQISLDNVNVVGKGEDFTLTIGGQTMTAALEAGKAYDGKALATELAKAGTFTGDDGNDYTVTAENNVLKFTSTGTNSVKAQAKVSWTNGDPTDTSVKYNVTLTDAQITDIQTKGEITIDGKTFDVGKTPGKTLADLTGTTDDNSCAATRCCK